MKDSLTYRLRRLTKRLLRVCPPASPPKEELVSMATGGICQLEAEPVDPRLYVGEIKGGMRPSMKLVVMGIIDKKPKRLVHTHLCLDGNFLLFQTKCVKFHQQSTEK
uniref:Uncharacterized protein n=1 Tax=Fundulus heteroclitus TaxID=8078 RepID=A0A3Q2NXJ2_FUNHE